MILLPSSIHSSHLRVMVNDAAIKDSCTPDPEDSTLPSTSSLGSSSSSLASPEIRPKMQVFEKYGCYYALDSNVLKLYQRLERSGQCDKVPVDVVAKKKIPPILWEAAYCSATPSDEEGDIRFGGEDDIGRINLDVDGNPAINSDQDNDSIFDICDDDQPMCVACGNQFNSIKELTEHQVLKRHFGCPVCGEVFNSCKKLERHEKLTLHGFDSDLDDV